MRWLLLSAAVGLIALGWATTAEVPWKLVSGWGPYLIQVLPRVTVDWPAVGMGAAAVVLFTAGVHWLGRTAVGGWRPTWSLAAVGTVVVAFAAGICLIGVVHQTGWLLAADEPAFVEVERDRFTASRNPTWDLKQTALGLHNLHDAYQGKFPPVAGPDGTLLHNWVTQALPYIGCYSPAKINFDAPWDGPENRAVFRSHLPFLLNPSLKTAPLHDADGYGLAHYAANFRAMANGNFRPLKEFTDGTANTLLIGEVNANFQPWGKPGNCRDPSRGINKSPHGFGGPLGSGGALFAMADGSVRFVSDRTSATALKALATPDGGEDSQGPP